MQPADTVHEASGDILWVTANIAFTWVPATVLAITGTAPGVPSPLVAVQEPVTTSDVLVFMQQSVGTDPYNAFYQNWTTYVALALVVSLLLVALIIYCTIRIRQIRHHERQKFAAISHSVAAQDVSKTQLRWNRIIEEAATNDEQKWRLAILEADIMLNELLDVLGYKGETMGDKMKQVPRNKFNTIDLAWEGHKVRNAIAHEGSARSLSPREVNRVIGLYETVFREFQFIR